MAKLSEDMLKMPEQPPLTNVRNMAGPTLELDRSKGRASLEFDTTAADLDGEARRVLQEEGLNPDEWVIESVRTSRWTMANGEEGRSARYGFARKGAPGRSVNVDEVLSWMSDWRPAPPAKPKPSHQAFLFLIGDFQVGKVDGDGVDGTLERAFAYTEQAIERYRALSGQISEVVIGFLGDHGEGFVSQNGANIFRTTLTNTEQERIIRRLFLRIANRFHEEVPADVPIKMVAVPGNHGDALRVNGKGATKYHDNHDTEALITVADALEFASEKDPSLKRVSFYVPQEDEITVTLDLAGTRTVFAHGHFHRPGKHFEWLKGQAFSKDSPARDADLLIEGHLHHFHVDTDSGVMFIGVPAVESESTWFRHRTGITGDPGAVVALTSDGKTQMEVIQ